MSWLHEVLTYEQDIVVCVLAAIKVLESLLPIHINAQDSHVCENVYAAV